MKFYEIIKKNSELKKKLKTKEFNIKILSNVTASSLKYLIEYSLRNNGLNANVEMGNYNNFLQESLRLEATECIIFFGILLIYLKT